MHINNYLKTLGKKIILSSGLVSILIGCEETPPSLTASKINKILKSKSDQAVLSTQIKFGFMNSDIVEGTELYISRNGERRLVLKTIDLITGIEVGDLNKDGVDDFIISYKMFDLFNKYKVEGTRSETYLSNNETFDYTKN